MKPAIFSTKYLARGVFILAALAALWGLYEVPTNNKDRIWPLGHHTRLLLDIVILVGYIVLAIATIVGICLLIQFLWEKTEWGKKK